MLTWSTGCPCLEVSWEVAVKLLVRAMVSSEGSPGVGGRSLSKLTHIILGSLHPSSCERLHRVALL